MGSVQKQATHLVRIVNAQAYWPASATAQTWALRTRPFTLSTASGCATSARHLRPTLGRPPCLEGHPKHSSRALWTRSKLPT
eukprot:5821864-Alexandrium_andersonii.AAC.1